MSWRSKLPVFYDLAWCGDRFARKLVAPLGRLTARLLAKGIPVLVKDVGKRAEGITELDIYGGSLRCDCGGPGSV
jgi:hypothetical protein